MHVITIATRNYVAYAEVMLASVNDHEPDAHCSIVVVDVDDRNGVDTRHEVLTLADLGFDATEIAHRRAIYDGPVELATSVKAASLAALLDRGATTAVYLDADLVLYRPLAGLEAAVAAHEVVLTPHLLHPHPMDGLNIGEEQILVAGVFNLGFLAVSPAARPFLRFWDERLRRDCRLDPEHGVFVDQRWIDQVPALFPHTVIRDPGWNVAYWNLHERPLSRADDGTVLARDSPLVFFHFSAQDPLDGAFLSRCQLPAPRILLSEHPLVAELCRDWSERVLENGAGPRGEADLAGWSTLEQAPLRRVYREACVHSERQGTEPPPSPATAGGRRAFGEWCRGPSPWAPDAGLPALLHVLWFLRPDLQAAFPSPDGLDAEGLTRFGRDDQRIRNELPAELLPDDAVTELHRRHWPALEPDPQPGLNVVGHPGFTSDVSEAGRRVVLAAEAAGLPVAATREHRRDQVPIRGGRDDGDNLLPFDTTVVAARVDRVAAAMARHGGHPARSSRRTVGLCFWEVDRLPEGIEASLGLLDELWAPSRYVEGIFREHTDLPIRRFPLSVTRPAAPTSLHRSDFGLPEDRFLFLSGFDFRDVVARTNPHALVDAYRRAFDPGDGAGLVLTFENGPHQLAELERLRLAAADRPDIEVRDGRFGRRQGRALLELCDAYASLHRAEGFGLPLANAMAAGKPVIATGFSGNLDFMDDANAYLVPYGLAEVGPGQEPYPAEAVWAEPDLDAAAALMRALADDRAAAAERGAAARGHMAALARPRPCQCVSLGRDPPQPRQRGRVKADDRESRLAADRLSDAFEEIERLEAARQAQNSMISRLLASLDEADRRAAAAEAEVAALHALRLWRWSAPFRGVYRTLRRGFGASQPP